MPLTVRRNKKSFRPRNVKRLKKKQGKIPKSNLEVIQKAWDNQKSAQKNLTDMGLAHDANVAVSYAIKHPEKRNSSKLRGPKSNTVIELEKEAKAPRVKKFKFPQAQARYFTYLIKKYGDNYKEMAKDTRNVYQETWKKIRSRIAQFKTLEQYQKFMSGQQ